MALEVAFQCLAAHERNDRSRSVKRTALVSCVHGLFENLAQHLGINGDLNVERCRLEHCEIEPIEEVSQDWQQGLVRNTERASIVKGGVFREQATIQERNIANERVQCGVVTADVPRARIVEPCEEELFKSINVEVGVTVSRLDVVAPDGVEVICLPFELQPSLA